MCLGLSNLYEWWRWCVCYGWQWDTLPCLGRRWIQSRVDAGELMARNGGAQKKHTRTPSTASATCTVAAAVQESLWNPILFPPPFQLFWALAAAAVLVEVGATRTFHSELLVLDVVAIKPNFNWTLFPMQSLAKTTTGTQHVGNHSRWLSKTCYLFWKIDIYLWTLRVLPLTVVA